MCTEKGFQTHISVSETETGCFMHSGTTTVHLRVSQPQHH